MMRANFLLHDLLLDTARAAPQRIAITCGATSIAYGELARRAIALAGALERGGVARGDRVLVFGDSSIDVVVAFWAALAANAVPIVIHPQTKPAKLAYLVEDSGASAIVHDARLREVVATADPPLLALAIGSAAWIDALEPRGAAPARACLDVDLAALVYTSGSTGEPKGVMLTHRNMLAACSSIVEYLGVRDDDVILCVLPLAFDYGLYQVVMATAVGARVVLECSFAFPAEVVKLIARERVTGLPGVPTLFATLVAMSSLAPADLASVRYVTNTAAALSPRHLRALRELVPHARVFSMYGLTECKRCTYLPPEDVDRKPDSVGIAIPNTELWIVDEHDRRLPPGEVGQLVIRGATVMRGYWNKPEATAKKLRPGPLPGELVLYTGDLCRLDDDGYLYFVARSDDIIKSRGEKVAPKAVEAALLDIAGVTEAAVVGVADELLGQAIKAFVVVDPAAALDAAAIQRECRARLESFMVPHEIVLRDALPKSANGKIQKSLLT
jgi:amino acid adenylation domain-containing protein